MDDRQTNAKGVNIEENSDIISEENIDVSSEENTDDFEDTLYERHGDPRHLGLSVRYDF